VSGALETNSGFIMDATWPLNRPHPPVGRVAPDYLERFPLSRYKITKGPC